MSTRTTVLWVPDWPVVAAATSEEVPPHVPTAVHDGRQLTAVSALARAEGVRRGMRRRQAQGVCPELVLLPADDARDVRLFEPVAAAAETVVAGIEVVRAGMLLLPAGGASRYHGSEDALAEKLIDAVAAGSGHECAVGTADGLLAAVLATRTGAVVPPGASAAYLAPRAMGELVHAAVTDEAASAVAELVDLLHRLGLRQLGHLAALPPTDVHARFGRLGAWAQLLARGDDERPPARRRPEADLEVAADLDPPLDRVDSATFAGRRLAEELHALLVQHSVTCGRLQISARTDEGTDLVRTWRTDLGGWGGLTPARITDRIRWQLEGWLAAGAVETARARAADDPAARARARTGPGRRRVGPGPLGARRPADRPLARRGLAGGLPGPPRGHRPRRRLGRCRAGAPVGRAVGRRPARRTGRWTGCRGSSAVRGSSSPPCRAGATCATRCTCSRGVSRPSPHGPWTGPGRVGCPTPHRRRCWTRPSGSTCGTRRGRPWSSTCAAGCAGSRPGCGGCREGRDEERDGRRGASARDGPVMRRAGDVGLMRGTSPSRGCGRPDDEPRAVAGWAGPWLLSERWWVAADDRPGLRAHLQVTFDDGRAVLLACTADGWTCEATYD